MPGTPFDSAIATAADALGFSQLQGSGAEGPGRSLSIEELGVSSPRRIILRGRAMPYQGVNWGGEQASKVTYYAGNPRGTLQVLGPRENETTMEGTWKDRFLRGSIEVTNAGATGAANAIGGAVASAATAIGTNLPGQTDSPQLAEDAIQLFHALRRAGTPVRVQWLSEVRFGIIKEFEAEYLRPQDVKWSATFEWFSWDDDASLRTAATDVVPASDLFDAFNQMMDILTLAPDVARAFRDTLIDQVNRANTTMQAVISAFNAIDTVLDTPGAVLGAMLANGRELDRQLSELISDLEDVRWVSVSGAQGIAGSTVSPLAPSSARSTGANQRLRFEAWRKSAGRSVVLLRRASEAGVSGRISRALPRTMRVVVVAEGATLYDLARRFYGSSDFASYLARANGLATALVAAGTRVRVPPRPTGPISRDLGMSGGKRSCEC